jgi:hypothetical protein
MKRLLPILILLMGTLVHAQIPGVNVTASLVDGQGNPQKAAYLHFQLWNCGDNIPQVQGNPPSNRCSSSFICFVLARLDSSRT